MKKKVLLCGFSRSGTTWLSKIFDSSPSVYLVSEPDKKIYNYLKLGKVNHFIKDADKTILSDYQEGINEVYENFFCELRSFPFFQKNYIRIPFFMYNSLSIFFQLLSYQARRYGFNGIKMPAWIINNRKDRPLFWKSVNQSSNLKFIENAFDDIKIVYILRNPFSSIASMLSSDIMSLDGFDLRRIEERRGSTFFKKNSVNFNEVKAWPEIKKKALLWRIEAENALRDGAESKNFKLVLYENLVLEPEKNVEELLKWLEIDYEDHIYNFLMESVGYKKPSFLNRLLSSGYFGIYRKPGINFKKWKDVITEEEYNHIHSVVEDSFLLKYWSDDIIKY